MKVTRMNALLERPSRCTKVEMGELIKAKVYQLNDQDILLLRNVQNRALKARVAARTQLFNFTVKNHRRDQMVSWSMAISGWMILIIHDLVEWL